MEHSITVPVSAATLRRVCVVDDDEGIRDALRTFFEDVGYEVEEQQDGASALLFLENTKYPWVLLLDRTMPRMNGVEFLRALIQRVELRRRASIVLMSARSDPLNHESLRLLESYIFAHVNKPFHLDDLLDTVERASERLAGDMAPEQTE